MAYADPLTLNDSAPLAHNFTKQQSVPNGSDWIDGASTATDVTKILIRHSNAGTSIVAGQKPIRRHLVQFTREIWNATLGKTEKMTLNVTLTVDPGTSFTETNRDDLEAFAANFLLSDTFTDRLMRDET